LYSKYPQVVGPTIGIPYMLKFITPATEYYISFQFLLFFPSQCAAFTPDPAKELLDKTKVLFVESKDYLVF